VVSPSGDVLVDYDDICPVGDQLANVELSGNTETEA
jgi:hypothetical protein